MPNSLMHRSLEERMAGKVISRVVTDGVALADAITEAVKFSDLNRQQTINLCAILQDYGMVYNGDPGSYFQSTEDMGKSVPNPEAGYQVYANDNSKIKTSALNKVFDTITELRKKGFKNEEIIAFNPDLGDILAAIDDAEARYSRVNNELNQRIETSTQQPAQEQVETEEQPAEEMSLAAMSIRGRFLTAQEADVEAPTEENIQNALAEDAPAEGEELNLADEAGDLGAEEELGAEDDLGGDDLGADLGDNLGGDDLGGDDLGGDVSATVRPTPADLETKISDAPEWEVENILSIQSAENFYNNLRKELEAVVFNENIVLDKGSLKKYDAIRAKIDEQLDKIKEAQSEKKKLEEKETDLEDKFEGGGEEELASEGELPALGEGLEGEAPTEEIVTEEGQESPFGKRNPK